MNLLGMIEYAATRAEKTYIKKIVNDNTIQRLTTAKLMGLPFKDIDPKKDQRWNYKKINAELLQAFENGETITQMSERLGRVSGMNEAAAIRNARTMTTSFENVGRLDGMKKMQENGTILKKQWLATVSTKKHKTRDWHKELSGQTAEIDEPFINHPNGEEKEEIMYPGDPNASAANVYNCRCTLTTVVEGFEPSKNYEVYVYDIGEKERIKYIDEEIELKRIETVNGEIIELDKPLKYGLLDKNISDEAREKLEKFEYKYLTKGGGVEHLMSASTRTVNFETGAKALESEFATGNKTSVEHISGDIVTHIHPRDLGALGGPFSTSDLRNFLNDGINTMRAVAKEGTYSISRAKEFSNYNFEVKLLWEIGKKEREFIKQYGQYATKEQLNNFLIETHNFLLKNQDRYGYFYTLERRKI